MIFGSVLPPSEQREANDYVRRWFKALPKPVDGVNPTRTEIDAALNQCVAILSRLRLMAHEHDCLSLLVAVQAMNAETNSYFTAALNATATTGLLVP